MEQPKTIELEVVKEEPQKEQSELVTIAGGVEIEIAHIDGRKETVKVRQIPATKIEEFMTKLADEATSVRIYCDKDDAWADSLTHESLTAIVEKGLEINSPFLNAWCLRRAKWLDMTQVGVIADLQKRITSLNEILQSVASAQKSAISTGSPRKK